MSTPTHRATEADALVKAIALQLQACEATLDYARLVEDPFERASLRITVQAQVAEIHSMIRHHAAHMLAVPIGTVSALKDQCDALVQRLNGNESEQVGCSQTLSVAIAKSNGLHQRCGHPCYAHRSEDSHGRLYPPFQFKETP